MKRNRYPNRLYATNTITAAIMQMQMKINMTCRMETLFAVLFPLSMPGQNSTRNWLYFDTGASEFVHLTPLTLPTAVML